MAAAGCPSSTLGDVVMAEPAGKSIPAPTGTPEWERWMADCRDVLKITERTWPAYLLGWQLRRLFEAGVVAPADAGLRHTLRRQMRHG